MPYRAWKCDDCGNEYNTLDGVVMEPDPVICPNCRSERATGLLKPFSCLDILNPWQKATYDSLPETQRYNAWFKENERDLRDKGYTSPSTDEARAATDDPDIFAEERKRIEKRADLLDSIDKSCREAEAIVKETKGNPDGIKRFKKDAIKDETPADIPTGTSDGGKELTPVHA